MRQPVSIIVNADDLGISREVNDAIFRLMHQGKVTSSTILANGLAVAEAGKLAARLPECSFGVHLNLTQFTPLSRSGVALVDPASGEFSRAIAQRRASRALAQAAYEEWTAQVERVAALGVRISHFDSHHHIHTVPALFPALKALQRRFGIRRVRISKNLYLPEDRPGAKLVWTKRIYNASLRHVYATATTEGFTEFLSYGQMLRNGGAPDCPSVELMAHPGAAKYAEETALLEGAWNADAPHLRLINYHAL